MKILIHMLDVEQGDCTVIQYVAEGDENFGERKVTDENGEETGKYAIKKTFTVLIDGGEARYVSKIIDFLQKKLILGYTKDVGWGEVDLVVISHMHSDHYGGVQKLFQFANSMENLYLYMAFLHSTIISPSPTTFHDDLWPVANFMSDILGKKCNCGKRKWLFDFDVFFGNNNKYNSIRSSYAKELEKSGFFLPAIENRDTPHPIFMDIVTSLQANQVPNGPGMNCIPFILQNNEFWQDSDGCATSLQTVFIAIFAADGFLYHPDDAEKLSIRNKNGKKSDNPNDASVVLLFGCGEFRYLTSGDMENEGEMQIAEAYPNLAVAAMKASHHGAETATPYKKLDVHKPALILVSAGGYNSHAHPRYGFFQVLNEYHEANPERFTRLALTGFSSASVFRLLEFYVLRNNGFDDIAKMYEFCDSAICGTFEEILDVLQYKNALELWKKLLEEENFASISSIAEDFLSLENNMFGVAFKAIADSVNKDNLIFNMRDFALHIDAYYYIDRCYSIITDKDIDFGVLLSLILDKLKTSEFFKQASTVTREMLKNHLEKYSDDEFSDTDNDIVYYSFFKFMYVLLEIFQLDEIHSLSLKITGSEFAADVDNDVEIIFTCLQKHVDFFQVVMNELPMSPGVLQVRHAVFEKVFPLIGEGDKSDPQAYETFVNLALLHIGNAFYNMDPETPGIRMLWKDVIPKMKAFDALHSFLRIMLFDPPEETKKKLASDIEEDEGFFITDVSVPIIFFILEQIIEHSASLFVGPFCEGSSQFLLFDALIRMRTMILPYLPEAIPDKFYPLETLFSHASELSEQSPSAEFLAPYYCDGHTEVTYKIDNIVKVAKNEEGKITLVPDDMDAFFVDVKDGYFSLKKNVKDAHGENVVVDWDVRLLPKNEGFMRMADFSCGLIPEGWYDGAASGLSRVADTKPGSALAITISYPSNQEMLDQFFPGNDPNSFMTCRVAGFDPEFLPIEWQQE